MSNRTTPLHNIAVHPPQPLIWLFIGFSLLGYVLPWAVTDSAALTLNAYDLAEWLSLHPQERTATIPLLASLLLRLQLVFIAWIGAYSLSGRRYGKGLFTVFLIAITIAQLPPLEFLAATGDGNYQQQFLLAMACLVGGLWLLLRPTLNTRRLPGLVLTLVGLLSSLLGLLRALELMQTFGLMGTPGAGSLLLCISYAGLIFTVWRYGRQPLRAA